MNDLSLPLVTIGIPTYNRLNFLKESVASALNQTYPNVEVLICQNPHQDEAIKQSIAKWCQHMQQLHPQIRHHLNPENQGAGANFNALADQAKGEYLLMIGDDDRLLPRAVDQLIAVIPGYTMAFSNHYLIDANGQRLDKMTTACNQFYGRTAMEPGEVNAEMAAWHRSPSVEATLFRTEAFRTIRMQEDLSAHDTHMFIQLARSGARFVFTPDSVSEIRTHGKSASAAGLETDKLAQVLIPIQVSPEIEMLKRDLIGQLLVGAVSRYLHQGNFAMARSLVQEPYFPKTSFTAKVQHLFALMPKAIGHPLYQFLWTLKNPAQKIAESSQHSEDFYNLPHLAIEP